MCGDQLSLPLVVDAVSTFKIDQGWNYVSIVRNRDELTSIQVP